ncbi:MAG: hypothetical protein QM723_35630 [Myxococcaceae bacterium]
MKLRYLVLAGALVASAVGFMSCGSSVSCSDKGPCANDVAPTQAQIDACNKLLNGACGTQSKTLAQCSKDNSTCGSDGHSTLTAGKCDTETSAFVTCCSGQDGGCF